MRRLALALTALLLAACFAPEAPAQERSVAFVGANVLPMDGERVLRDHTVVVVGDRIVRVGPRAEVEVPQGAEVVDAAGRYLLPGLAEMHGHIPPPSEPQENIDDVLFLYVANGITTVRGMLGHDGQLALRDQANRGAILSPTLYLAGPSFSGQSVSAPEQAAAKVRQQHEEGWDLLKVHPGLSRAEYDAMALQAHALGIRFGGHVPEEVGLVHALAMGQETFDHLDGYVAHLEGERAPIDAEALDDIVERTREAGAWVVPTMVLWETLYGTLDLATVTGFDELKYMPPATVEWWTNTHRNRLERVDLPASRQRIQNRMQILKALSDGGAKILMGTDAPQQFSVPGFSLHRELARMAEAGMTPYEILKSGTANVGDYFFNEDRFGLVRPGHRADLVLVEGNPLDDLAHLARRGGVMVRGRWLPEAEIQQRLAAIADRHAGG